MLKENITHKQEHLNELVGIKVAESNALIDSIQDMNLQAMKIFGLAVAKIDTKNPPEDRTVILNKDMVIEALKLDNSSVSSQLKKYINKLHQQVVFSMVEAEDGFIYENISPIERSSFNSYNKDIRIMFSPSCFPLIANVKGSFTQYFILDLINLNSKYSVSLFKRLSKDYNFFENKEYDSNWSSANLEKKKNPYISFQELREKNNLEGKLKDKSNFLKTVVANPVKDINENTTLNVTYETIYSGRQTIGVKFFVTKKDKAPYDYKLDDSLANESKKQKQERQEKTLMYAMQSPFNTLLVERNLISYKDFADTDFMISLGEHVYPIYEQIQSVSNEGGGRDGLVAHLDHVTEFKIDFSKKNRTKYLAKSAKQRLDTIKG